MTIFWSKKFYNSLQIGPNFFLYQFKNKISLNFVIFVATKKGTVGQQIKISPPPPFFSVAVFKYGIRYG